MVVSGASFMRKPHKIRLQNGHNSRLSDTLLFDRKGQNWSNNTLEIVLEIVPTPCISTLKFPLQQEG